jgi:hypothetical protein
MALMAARMPAATHVRLQGTGHLVHTDPTARAVIVSFVTTHM